MAEFNGVTVAAITLTATQRTAAAASQYGDYLPTTEVGANGFATVTVRTGDFVNSKGETVPYRVGSVLVDGLSLNVAGLPETSVTGDTLIGVCRTYQLKPAVKTAGKKDKNGVALPDKVVRFEYIGSPE